MHYIPCCTQTLLVIAGDLLQTPSVRMRIAPSVAAVAAVAVVAAVATVAVVVMFVVVVVFGLIWFWFW